jgi:hypothetical protein
VTNGMDLLHVTLRHSSKASNANQAIYGCVGLSFVMIETASGSTSPSLLGSDNLNFKMLQMFMPLLP